MVYESINKNSAGGERTSLNRHRKSIKITTSIFQQNILTPVRLDSTSHSSQREEEYEVRHIQTLCAL